VLHSEGKHQHGERERKNVSLAMISHNFLLLLPRWKKIIYENHTNQPESVSEMLKERVARKTRFLFRAKQQKR
jgi:hypothetical protein